jgi:hypothetical protein
MVLTLCQWIKKMWNVDNLWGKKLELSECQGTRDDGDNPLDPLSPTFSGFVFPHFTTAYGPHVYENTTFSPLTLSGGPVFYYIYFPDKKGRFRTRRGETSLRVFHDYSVMVLPPFNEGTDMFCCPPMRWTHSPPLVVETFS